MATRSQIFVSDKEVLNGQDFLTQYGEGNRQILPSMYKHWDGYMSATLPTLIPFLYYFNKNRGFNDTTYLLAQMPTHFIDEQGLVAVDKREYTGFGIQNYVMGGIEYAYIIDTEAKNLIVLSGYNSPDDKDYSDWEEVFSLDLTLSLEEQIALLPKED